MWRTKSLLCDVLGRDLAGLTYAYFMARDNDQHEVVCGDAGNWEICDAFWYATSIGNAISGAVRNGYFNLADHLAAKIQYNWNRALYEVCRCGRVDLISKIYVRGGTCWETACFGATNGDQPQSVFEAIRAAEVWLKPIKLNDFMTYIGEHDTHKSTTL